MRLATERCIHFGSRGDVGVSGSGRFRPAEGRVNTQADGCSGRKNMCVPKLEAPRYSPWRLSVLWFGGCLGQSFCRNQPRIPRIFWNRVRLVLTTLLIYGRHCPAQLIIFGFNPFFLYSPLQENQPASNKATPFSSIMASGGLTCVKYLTFFCNLLFAVSSQRKTLNVSIFEQI